MIPPSLCKLVYLDHHMCAVEPTFSSLVRKVIALRVAYLAIRGLGLHCMCLCL